MTNLEIFLFLNLSEVIQENLGLSLPPNSPDLHQNNKMKSCSIPAPSFPRNENHKVLKQRWRHFTSLKLCQCSQIPQPPPKVTSTFNRMKTTIIGLIIYKYSTLTSIHHLARQMTEGNFGLTFVPHSLNLTPETKRRNLRLPSAFISFSYTSNTEKDSSTR